MGHNLNPLTIASLHNLYDAQPTINLILSTAEHIQLDRCRLINLIYQEVSRSHNGERMMGLQTGPQTAKGSVGVQSESTYNMGGTRDEKESRSREQDTNMGPPK